MFCGVSINIGCQPKIQNHVGPTLLRLLSRLEQLSRRQLLWSAHSTGCSLRLDGNEKASGALAFITVDAM